MELKQMALYIEPAFQRQFPLYVVQIAAGNIDDYATIRTNQVVVVFQGSPYHIASAPVLAVNPAQ